MPGTSYARRRAVAELRLLVRRRWDYLLLTAGLSFAVASLWAGTTWWFTRNPSLGWFVAGVVIGCSSTAALAFVAGTDGITRWTKGYVAEWSTKDDLRVHRPDMSVFEGLNLQGDIDLVAVGPTGVFAIEVKYRARDQSARAAEQVLAAAVQQARRGARSLRLALGPVVATDVVPVAMIQDHLPHPELPTVVEGVLVAYASQPGWWDRLNSSRLEPSDVEAIRHHLAGLAERQARAASATG